MVVEPGTLRYLEIKSSVVWTGLIAWCRNSFLCSRPVFSDLSSGCASFGIWPVPLTHQFPVWQELGPLPCRVRAVRAEHHPKGCRGKPTGLGACHWLPKAILPYLFVWLKHRSIHCASLAFLGHPKPSSGLTPLLLVAGVVMFFTVLHEVGLLPWRWKQVLLAWAPQY